MTTPHQHDTANVWDYDSVDDYTRPSYNAKKPGQHLAQTLTAVHHEEATTGASTVDYLALAENILQARGGGVEKEDNVMRMDESVEIMDLLGVQLEKEMTAIEEEEDTCHQETSIRVIFMGAATENDKRICIQKLSQALLIRSRQKFVPSNHFKERKLQIVRGPQIDEQIETDCSVAVGTFEDIGLSIIEADFSWSTGRRKQPVRYARQLLRSRNDGQALSLLGDQKEDPFVLYPRTHDNGIDICIYFYEDSHHPDVVEEDLAYLWQLQTMSVSILPILVGDVTGSNVSTRRAQLAELLVLHKIRCKNFKIILDVGPPPSFARSPRHHLKDGQANIGKRPGTKRTLSTHTRSAPRDILTIAQFSALNGRTLSNTILEEYVGTQKERTRKNVEPPPPPTFSAAAAAAAVAGMYHRRLFFWPILVPLLFVMATLWSRKFSFVRELPPTALHKPLSAQVYLTRRGDGCSFIHFNICDDTMTCEQHQMPLPLRTQDDFLALGTVYIGTNSSQVDIIKHHPAITCLTTATTSPSDKEGFQPTNSYRSKERLPKSWSEYYQTAVFIFKNRSRILDVIFTKTIT